MTKTKTQEQLVGPSVSVRWRFFTADQAAEVLKLNRRTVLKLLKEGKLPGKKIGKSWRISEQLLHRFLGADV